jgi:hypothetical protein
MRRPPLGAVLDRRHPLAHGLVAAWLFNEGGGSTLTDLVRGFTARGNVAPTTGWSYGGWYGQNYRFPGAAPVFAVPADPRLTPQATDPGWTVIVRAHFEGANYTNRIGVNCELRWRLLSGEGNGTVISARWGASWTTLIAGGPTLRDRVPFDAALRWSRGQGVVSLFHNGVRVATSSQGAPPTTPVELNFGNINAAGSNWWLGNIYHVYIYNVPLSDDAIATLAADPYGMFRGPVQRKGAVTFLEVRSIPSGEAFGTPEIVWGLLAPVRYRLAPGRSQAQMVPYMSRVRPAPTATAAPVAGMTTRAATAPGRTRSRE